MYEDTLNRPAKSLYFLRNGYYEVWKWYILYFFAYCMCGKIRNRGKTWRK